MSAAPVAGWNRRPRVPESMYHPGLQPGQHAPFVPSWNTLPNALDYVYELSPQLGEGGRGTIVTGSTTPFGSPRPSPAVAREELNPTSVARPSELAMVPALLRQIADLQARIETLERAHTCTSERSPDRPEDPILAAGRWLSTNARTYQGQWVALSGERLMGQGRTLDLLEEDLKTNNLSRKGLFITRVP